MEKTDAIACFAAEFDKFTPPNKFVIGTHAMPKPDTIPITVAPSYGGAAVELTVRHD